MKKLIVALCALTVCACASASDPSLMAAEVTETTTLSANSVMRDNVSVGTVSGGRETNPLWTSQVSDDAFAEALRQSFAAHAMLATEQGDFRLDAELVELSQPLAGFDMTVHAQVQYTLTNVQTGAVVFDQRIAESHTATVGDAFMGVERLRLANEGSIKTNIATLIERLIDTLDAETGSSATDAVAP